MVCAHEAVIDVPGFDVEAAGFDDCFRKAIKSNKKGLVEVAGFDEAFFDPIVEAGDIDECFFEPIIEARGFDESFFNRIVDVRGFDETFHDHFIDVADVDDRIADSTHCKVTRRPSIRLCRDGSDVVDGGFEVLEVPSRGPVERRQGGASVSGASVAACASSRGVACHERRKQL